MVAQTQNNKIMKTISKSEAAELRLFMIANGYSSRRIKSEMSKYLIQ
jgi:hypothetical protein